VLTNTVHFIASLEYVIQTNDPNIFSTSISIISKSANNACVSPYNQASC